VSERLLTARELGAVLGFKAGTIVDWAEVGKIPAFKVGGRLRFRESEVLAWLETHRLAPRQARLTHPVGRTTLHGSSNIDAQR
jgi:excisionase family DNA binding protein